MEKIKNLISNGLDESLAILLVWPILNEEDKRSFDFETIYSAWFKAPKLSQEKSDMYQYAKDKAETFDQVSELFRYVSDKDENERLFKDLKKKAQTLDHWLILWDYAGNNKSKKDDVFVHFKDESKTFHQLKVCWNKVGQDKEKQLELWPLLQEKYETFSEVYFLWENSEKGSSEESQYVKVLKEKREDFEDLKKLWVILDNQNDGMSDEDWQFFKDRVETFNQHSWLYEVAPVLKGRKKEAWDLLNESALTLEECILFWKRPCDIAKKLITWRKILKKIETFKDCILVWDYINNYNEGKIDVLSLAIIKAESDDDWFWIFQNSSEGSQEKEVAWIILEERANTYIQAERIFKKVLKGSAYEIKAIDLLRKRVGIE